MGDRTAKGLAASALSYGAAAAPKGSQAAALMSRLALGKEGASILVLGDSTGDETTTQGRWVLKLAQYLAAKFPAYTVNFRQYNAATGSALSDSLPVGAYDALGSGQSQVVQTGTGAGNAGGPFVLDVYNGSVSGSAPAYHVLSTRWPTVTPTSAAPNLVIINHGHNIGGADGEGARFYVTQLTRAVTAKFPLAGVLLTAQNPRDPAQGEYANDLLRARAMIYAAALGGFGVINILQRFWNNPSYASQWLADGLHPNAAGSLQWFQEVAQHFALPSQTSVASTSPSKNRDHLYLPASQFSLYTGTPALAVVNSECPMWSFAQSATSGICLDVLLPEHWLQFDAWLMWCVAGTSGYTSSTVAAWNLYRQQRANSYVVPAEQGTFAPPAWVTQGVQTKNPNNGTAYQTVMSQINTQATAFRAPMGLRIQRETSGDALSETAYVKGLLLVRAL